MGAWGVGIFDDDVACDVRIALYDLLRAGQSTKEATDAVLEDLADMLADVEDGPIVILALAAAQWEAGRLDSRIKRRALKIIAEGVDFRWQDSEHREQRRAVLEELAARLNQRPPPPKPVEELEGWLRRHSGTYAGSRGQSGTSFNPDQDGRVSPTTPDRRMSVKCRKGGCHD